MTLLTDPRWSTSVRENVTWQTRSAKMDLPNGEILELDFLVQHRADGTHVLSSVDYRFMTLPDANGRRFRGLDGSVSQFPNRDGQIIGWVMGFSASHSYELAVPETLTLCDLVNLIPAMLADCYPSPHSLEWWNRAQVSESEARALDGNR